MKMVQLILLNCKVHEQYFSNISTRDLIAQTR